MEIPYYKKDESIVPVQSIFEQITKNLKEENINKSLRDALIFARSIIGTIREPLVVLDSNLKVISANKSYYKKFKEKKENIEAKYFYQLSEGIWNSPKLKDLLEKIVPQKTFFEGFEIEAELKDIGKRTFLLNARQLDDLLEYKKLILLAIEDITESKKLEILTKKKLGFLLDSTNDSFVFLNDKLELIEANNLFFKKIKIWYGLQKKSIIGKKITEIIPDFKKLESYKRLIQVIKEGKSINWDEMLSDTRNRKVYLDSRAFILDGGVGIIFSDITVKKEAEKWLKYLSFHDKLTGLYNRAFFEEEIARLSSNRQLPLSIIMGDINGLKLINDTFGHSFGDKLLINTAKLLKSVCRNEDIIARLGGDEFIILLPNSTEKDAIHLTDRIRKECKKSSGTRLQINIALGTSTKNNLRKNFKTMLGEADNKMVHRKLLESEDTINSMILLLQRSSKENSYGSNGHSTRLKKMAVLLGTISKLPKVELDKFLLLATLHDIGKITIAKKILNKKGKLTEKEWAIVKKHSEIGKRIASASPHFIHIASEILFSHEWWDGKGYPKGIKEENIPLLSRMLSVIDAYDAMVKGRPYKKAISKKEALKELKKCAGSQFDPSLVTLFTKLINKK